MTDEEYVIILKNCASMLADGIKHMKEEHQKQFKEAYEKAIETLSVEPQEWIPVTERLPEEYGRYLVTVDSEMIREKHVVTDDFFFPFGWDNYKDDVVAWMPLPSPYKGDTE